MYKLVGADGREYGPITADQLTDWIRQGRAAGRTLVQFQDGPWQPLASYPEFATALAQTGGGAPLIPPTPSSPVAEISGAGTTGSAGSTGESQAASEDSGQSIPPPPKQYYMRGADGREYGPVAYEQMRGWIIENRAGPQTMVRRDNSTDWHPLATYQEFAALFPSYTPGGATGETKPEITADRGSAPAMDPHLLSEHIRGRDYRVQIGECFGRGWELFKANAGTIIGAEILLFIMVALGYAITGSFTGFNNTQLPPTTIGKVQFFSMTFVGSAIQTVLNALATAGFFAFLLNLMRGYRPPITNVFMAFSRLAGPLVALEFVRAILALFGFILCILPGIYLMIAWMFAVPVLLDKRYSFWDSMEVSRKVISHHWFQVFLFIILMSLFTMLGVLACFVGLLVTIPVATAAFLYLYEDIFDIDKPSY